MWVWLPGVRTGKSRESGWLCGQVIKGTQFLEKKDVSPNKPTLNRKDKPEMRSKEEANIIANQMMNKTGKYIKKQQEKKGRKQWEASHGQSPVHGRKPTTYARGSLGHPKLCKFTNRYPEKELTNQITGPTRNNHDNHGDNGDGDNRVKLINKLLPIGTKHPSRHGRRRLMDRLHTSETN